MRALVENEGSVLYISLAAKRLGATRYGIRTCSNLLCVPPTRYNGESVTRGEFMLRESYSKGVLRAIMSSSSGMILVSQA